MKKLTKKQMFIRLLLGLPFIPVQLTLRFLEKAGEKVGDLNAMIAKFLLTKIVLPEKYKDRS